MNTFVKTSLFSLSLLAVAGSLQAQDPSGVIKYEITTRLGGGEGGGEGRVMVIRSSGGGETVSEGSDVMTFNQTFTFNGIFGKLESERGGFGSMPMNFSMPAGAAGGRQDVVISSASPAGAYPGSARPSGNGAGQGIPQLPFRNATYIDLSKKQFLQVLETTDAKKEAWFTAEAFKSPAEFKESDKTKKIAGYNCKKATVKLNEEAFTIWYTTEIPLTFSPINGIVPPNGGFVLSAESSRRSIEAKKVDLKPVEPGDVMPPATAEKVDQKEMNDKRRQLMEKFRNEQMAKQQ
jgi:hypothetical protein